MSILGIGQKNLPHVYLDDFMPDVDMDELNLEVCRGIALSKWNKRYVSSGAHPDWAMEEISTYIRMYKRLLHPKAVEVFESFRSTDEKIKFINCYLKTLHPFWVIYLRNNKRIEYSGIQNKSVGVDCEWTENAEHFPKLVNFIKQMPFREIGRVIFFMTEANNQTVPHYDAANENQRLTKGNDNFVWFTTSEETKSVFVMDGETHEKYYQDPTKRFVYFNEMDYHGTDPVPHFSFSIRIDGVFTDELKEKLFNK